MLRFRKRSQGANGTLGAYIAADGICLAHVQAAAEGRPRARLFWVEPRTPQALRGLLKSEKLDRLSCNAVLDADHYQLVMTEAPDMPLDELRAAMRWRVKDMIGYPVEDAAIDVFRVPEGSRLARTESVFVVAAQLRTVNTHSALLLDSGLELNALDIADLAVRNVVVLHEYDADGVGVLYFMPSYSLFSIYRQGQLYLSRRLPLGLGDVRVALNDGETAQDDLLAQLTPELRRSVDYYESYYRMPPIKCVCLWPPVDNMAQLATGLAEILGPPSRVPDLGDMVEVSGDVGADHPGALLALGVALRQEEPV